MSRHQSNEPGKGKDQVKIRPAFQCGFAFAHAEAARQHAAAADAHALAAELHFETLVPDGDFEPTSEQDAICASADAAIQTNTAIEASELAGGAFSTLCDAQREAKEASRVAGDGEDPRGLHAQAAEHHAVLAETHARSVQAIAPRSQEAHDAAFDAEVASTRAIDAEVARQAA
jgi:hypothetical protein